jgi:arginine utilization protein RocB
MLNCRNEVEQLTKQLVKVESVVNTPGEASIAQMIHDHIQSFPYYRHHPEQVTKVQTVRDDYERYNVLAFVKGTKSSSNRTVILMGHMDTVGIDDYNQWKSIACDPDALIQAFKQSDTLSPSVKKHLDSEEWLFGRGMLDMKSGVAGHLYLLRYFSEHPEELEGNLVVLVECDEEDSSNGILSALKTLKAWKELHHFDYIAAINSDFVSPRYEGDDNRYIYMGTVGKLLPSFFIAGAESHVGSCFEGLDPNFIAAELNRQINYNPALCDQSLGETPAPPVSLRLMDLKPSYTVQTALSTYVYFNFFTHSWSPERVLDILQKEAHTAFDSALTLYRDRYEQFCRMTGEPFQEIQWKPRIYTFNEMHQLLVREHGETYASHMRGFYDHLLEDRSLDIRMFSVRMVEQAWKWMRDHSPAIILFYSSLYSPRIEVSGKNEREKALMNAVHAAIQHVKGHYPHPIVTRQFFPYISDMSFVALSDNEQEINAVINNSPAWGKKHYVDFQDIRDINVPVINIGPYGMDAHKKYERMEASYSLEIVPNLIYQAVKSLIG